MKLTNLCALSFAVAVILLPAVSRSQPTSAKASPSPAISASEALLVDLHNGLIRAAVLEGSRAGTAADLWSVLQPRELQTAVKQYYGVDGGGLLTSGRVYPRRTSVTVAPSGEFDLSLSLPGTGWSSVLGNRNGLQGCAILPVTATTVNPRIVVGANVRCLFARSVGAAIAATSPTSQIDWQFVQTTSVEEQLTAYLQTLKSQGRIQSFSVDLGTGLVHFRGTSSVETQVRLSLSLINRFPTPEAEAAHLTDTIQEMTASAFVHLTPNGGIVTLGRPSFDRGLQAAAALPTPSLRRSAFFAALGLQPGGSPSAPAPAPAPCRYATGTVTPCNKNVVVLWGADGFGRDGAFNPGSDGFNELQGALSGYGYTLRTIDVQRTLRSGDENVFKAIGKAQTLIMNVHGGADGSTQWQCYETIQGANEDGPTRECCEAMKRTAQALNLPNSDAIDCTQAPPPYGIPGISTDTTYSNPCPGTPQRWVERPIGSGIYIAIDPSTGLALPTNRCQIYATPDLFTLGIGTKAAVFTAQCYGGRCPSLPGVGGTIMDLFTQTTYSNYPATEKCDDKLISQDVKGESLYCLDTTRVPGAGYSEPFSGRANGQCAGADDSIAPGVPSSLRTVQSSIEARWGPSGWNTSCRNRTNGGGFKQYEAANSGGDTDVLVEFAPAVGRALYSPSLNLLTVLFTSPLKNGCTVEVENQGGAVPTVSTNKPFSVKGCGPSAAIVRFSGDPRILSAQEWGRPAAELQAIYGNDQSNWPWFIKVKVKGEAPNGIALVGNQGASKKWYWSSPLDPSPIPPFLHSSGVFGSGGQEFEIHFPVAPSMSCCIPQIEWEGNPPRPVQNGCNCTATGKDYCFTGTCVTCDDGNCSSAAAPGMTAAECAGGSYRRFEGQWNVWHDCCSVSVKGQEVCEQYRQRRFPQPPECQPGETFLSTEIEAQHIARPWDQSGPEQCPTQRYYTSCAID